jgi:hypothetical protein
MEAINNKANDDEKDNDGNNEVVVRLRTKREMHRLYCPKIVIFFCKDTDAAYSVGENTASVRGTTYRIASRVRENAILHVIAKPKFTI